MTLGHEQGDSELERRLAELSAWDAPAPGVWKRVAPGASTGVRGVLNRPLPRTLMNVAALVCIVALGIGILLPGLSKARSVNRVAKDLAMGGTPSSAPVLERMADRGGTDGFISGWSGGATNGAVPDYKVEQRWRIADPYERADVSGLTLQARAAFGSGSPQIGAGSERQPQTDAGRQVIRKAMMEIVATDVRTVFMKVPLILSEAQGEFVQESSMLADAREPDRVTATVVLRVTASRLSKVLTELRELGKVTNETAGGEDVTDQLVDLEARIRNEQRIEKELLALLDTRKDSPLKEIMELRGSLDTVRQGIERMAAQRERIGKLVNLATVMVVVRSDKAAPQPAPAAAPTIGEKFKEAAKNGWSTLMGSVMWVMETAIGGLLWWVPMAFLALMAWRGARRLLAVGAEERAPTR